MTIHIAVVDDEKKMVDAVCGLIQKTVGDRPGIEIHTFSSGEAFLEQMGHNIRFDILFCDIELNGGINGIELGRMLKPRYSDLYLVYLTSHSDYASESYVLEAYQYILKSDMNDRLPVILTQIIQRIEKSGKKFLVIGTYLEQQKIYYADIIYLCKAKGAKYVQYMTIHGEYRERITLEEALKKMDSTDFILVERGYAVNMKHIHSIRGNVITLTNKEQVVISRARCTKVKEQVNQYWHA